MYFNAIFAYIAHTFFSAVTVVLLSQYLQINLLFFFRPGYTKIVPGEGMPLSQDPSKKGDLVIEFEIEFPTSLSPERKDLIKRALLQ